jgi:hypothetical protein
VCLLAERQAPVAQWIEHLITDQKVPTKIIRWFLASLEAMGCGNADRGSSCFRHSDEFPIWWDSAAPTVIERPGTVRAGQCVADRTVLRPAVTRERGFAGRGRSGSLDAV